MKSTSFTIVTLNISENFVLDRDLFQILQKKANNPW